MKTYTATNTEAQQFEQAVWKLADLAGIISQTRAEFVLAGCGTFDTQKEHAFLIRLEKRLRRTHAKLAARILRTRIVSDPI